MFGEWTSTSSYTRPTDIHHYCKYDRYRVPMLTHNRNFIGMSLHIEWLKNSGRCSGQQQSRTLIFWDMMHASAHFAEYRLYALQLKLKVHITIHSGRATQRTSHPFWEKTYVGINHYFSWYCLKETVWFFLNCFFMFALSRNNSSWSPHVLPMTDVVKIHMSHCRLQIKQFSLGQDVILKVNAWYCWTVSLYVS